METYPKVSVIIPVYNTEKYLRECLDSIVSQTLKEIEVICVDDGSTDGSLGILREYAAGDPRVTVMEQSNEGAGAARNYGLTKAIGEYLSFLDSDDFFEPTMLEKAYIRAKSLDAQIVVFRTKRYLEESDIYQDCKWTVKSDLIPKKDTFTTNEIKQNLFLSMMGYTWDKLFRFDFVREMGIRFQEQPVFNDSYFTYCLLLSAQRITFLDEVLVCQRKRETHNSITDRRTYYIDCSYAYLKALKIFLEEKGMYKRYEPDFLNYAVHLLYLDLSSKQGEYRVQFLKLLKDSWLSEFDLWNQQQSVFYKANKYKQLMEEVMGKKEPEMTATSNTGKAGPRLIVSFTSYPARIHHVDVVVECLLKQTRLADKIVLWLAEEQFPGKLQDLPQKLQEYAKGDLDIRWCDDLKSHKKYFYTMQEFPDDIIVTVDDDVYYEKTLLEKLMRSYARRPNVVSCMRSHTIAMYDYRTFLPYEVWHGEMKLVEIPSFLTLPTGVGGVLYPPHCLPKETFDKERIKELCLNADDLWLKWMQLKNGVKCVLLKDGNVKVSKIDTQKEEELWIENVKKGGNDIAWTKIIYSDDGKTLDGRGIKKMLFEEYSRLVLKDRREKTANLTLIKELESYKRELKNVRSSWSYKIGRLVTFIPRKVRGGIRCVRENGLSYTLRRLKEKLTR